MSHSNSSIQALYDRVLRLTRVYGLDPHWELVPGRERTNSTPRTSWRIEADGLVLFDLGYTRRNAYDTLNTIGTVFEYLISTEDWKEDVT